MNKILLQIIAFVLFSTSVFAQIPKLDHIKNLKESKIIIGLSHNENLNINLTKMVNQYWNLCQIDGALPYKEAIQKAKNDDNTFVIFVSTMTSRGLKHNFDENWDFRLIFRPNSIYCFIFITRCVGTNPR